MSRHPNGSKPVQVQRVRGNGRWMWPVPVVVNRWSVRMPSSHDDLGSTSLVPEPMIDRMCPRDPTSTDDHADHHSQWCGIIIFADTGVFASVEVTWPGCGGRPSNQSSVETGVRCRSGGVRPMGWNGGGGV